MNITLNEAEQKLCYYIAKRRYQNARSNSIPDHKIGPQSCEETDLEGIGAEVAWCKVNNLYPDTEITEGYTPAEDCISHNGLRIDVKSTKYPNGHLLATLKKKDKRCDLYALVIGAFPTYRIAGYVPAEELFKEENIKNFGHGDGFALAQGDLMEF